MPSALPCFPTKESTTRRPAQQPFFFAVDLKNFAHKVQLSKIVKAWTMAKSRRKQRRRSTQLLVHTVHLLLSCEGRLCCGDQMWSEAAKDKEVTEKVVGGQAEVCPFWARSEVLFHGLFRHSETVGRGKSASEKLAICAVEYSRWRRTERRKRRLYGIDLAIFSQRQRK